MESADSSLMEFFSHIDKRNNNRSWLLHVELFSEYYPILWYKPRRAEDWLLSPVTLWLWCPVLSFFVLWHSGYCIRFVCSAACNLNRVDWTPSDHKNFDYPCPDEIYWYLVCHPSTPFEWLAICDVDSDVDNDVAPCCACFQHQWESHGCFTFRYSWYLQWWFDFW